MSETRTGFRRDVKELVKIKHTARHDVVVKLAYSVSLDNLPPHRWSPPDSDRESVRSSLVSQWFVPLLCVFFSSFHSLKNYD